MGATKLGRLMTKGARASHRPIPIANGKALRILDKTKPLQPAPEAAQWLVAMVAPRREADAVKALHEAGYRAWHPQLTTWQTNARMRVKTKVNLPLFPRYVFVAQQPGASKPIIDCDHVGYVIGPVPARRKGRPTLLEALSDRQGKGEFVVKTFVAFDIGDKVRISDDGPFTGFEGIVYQSDSERVHILLHILGGENRVEVDARSLQVA